MVKELEEFISAITTDILILSDMHTIKFDKKDKGLILDRVIKNLQILEHSCLYHAGYLDWNEDGTWTINEKQRKHGKGNYKKKVFPDKELIKWFRNLDYHFSKKGGDDIYIDDLQSRIEMTIKK